MDGFFCWITRTFGHMSVAERFIQYLHEQALCQPHQRLLLAVSGGKDSVMMTRLFVESGYAVGIAHCNFGLRGEESEADEALVYQLAKTLDVPFYVTRFDTVLYARQEGISIQMAARELRYAWFETICVSQDYDYIAVAQHRNDHVETLIFNLVRGTGLAGLQGIRPKRGRIIRPMLFLNAAEITAYVQQHGLEYRDDASNFSTKYARNKIRMEVIPKLKELNPDLEETLTKNMAHFSDAYVVLQRYIEHLRTQLFSERAEGEWHIPVVGLASLDPQQFLLYELFKPFGFTEAVLSDLASSLGGTPGKQFVSPSHVLYIDREEVVLTSKKAVYEETVLLEKGETRVQWGEYNFKFHLSSHTEVETASHIGQFDAHKIIFPLRIRSWRKADMFQPLGMKGHKKLSDLFISLKIPVYRKHRVPIVVNGNGDILWVVPYRMDDRYKITGKTKKVLTLACI
ncbi:tRNA lysidine(34) synthetase TilS [Parapedobacter indicus]|uniref:tRNA(Ile)-lysidine synthase n=1 Tax=Parapedobacter indicus TaxID=1477437 RepID=A0A1I3CXS3_9SPHI|nr:tRNA lysidine(34) synthetase TilS [Parapedobacter indicus]PPL04444.1 tRNA(Ile)-lysidine synthase [Parapedobacter indicus]SFH79285.1 tRNA(Ile)-lysidine synthase [Parapedobacter indicus]